MLTLDGRSNAPGRPASSARRRRYGVMVMPRGCDCKDFLQERAAVIRFVATRTQRIKRFAWLGCRNWPVRRPYGLYSSFPDWQGHDMSLHAIQT